MSSFHESLDFARYQPIPHDTAPRPNKFREPGAVVMPAAAGYVMCFRVGSPAQFALGVSPGGLTLTTRTVDTVWSS